MEQPEAHFGVESPEDAEVTAFQAALAHERALLEEVDTLLRSAPERVAAERLVVERYAAQIEAAMAVSRTALDTWLNKIRRVL
jgi:hypothetical protein